MQDSEKKELLDKSNEEEGRDEEAEMQTEEDDEAASLKARQALTGRNVTLNTLMDDGTIAPGKKVLSIDYLGQRFEADLLENGKIKWDGSEEEFGTPSAWAHHCKRLVNPIKRSGCGWASVKYNNKKLDLWKSIWARKHRVNKSPYKNEKTPVKARKPNPLNLQTRASSPENKGSHPEQENPRTSPIGQPQEESIGLKEEEEKVAEEKSETDTQMTCSTSLQKILTSDPALKSPTKNLNAELNSEENSRTSPITSPSERQKDVPKKDSFSHIVQVQSKNRKCVPYSALGVRSLDIDRHTLVQCEKFDSHSKLQPFSVSVASNALLLMDFHCNLTKSEVVGYFGGRWDSSKQHLHLEQVFPVHCSLGDGEQGALVEDTIRRSMRARSMTVVGWYHSHPYCPAQPSLHDVDAQMGHQLKMRGSGSMYQPCLAFIVSPWQPSSSLESQIQAFWVMPNLEHPAAYNIPMSVSYNILRDSSLTEDILTDMKNLSENYSAAQDRLIMKDEWRETVSFSDKMKASIKEKLPEDQLDSDSFLQYMTQLVCEGQH